MCDEGGFFVFKEVKAMLSLFMIFALLVILVICIIVGTFFLKKNNDEIEAEATVEILKILKVSIKNIIRNGKSGK